MAPTTERAGLKGRRLPVRRRRRWPWLLLPVLPLVLAAAFAFYVSDPYPAHPEALAALVGNESVRVVDRQDHILFRPLSAGETPPARGIILYPGGKVKAEAYAALALALAEKGLDVYLVRMPFQLAVLDPLRAGRILDLPESGRSPNLAIAGHSLGGAMAVRAVRAHPDDLDEIIFLGSYSDLDIRTLPVRVLSIGASEDGLSTPAKILSYRENLPPDARLVTLPGGNHAGFGRYGPQSGDGIAVLSPEEQQRLVVEAILSFLAEADT